MTAGPSPLPRLLIAIPAYNEAATIEDVVQRVRAAMPQHGLLIIDDGSRDGTADILRRVDVMTATHLCNLGYGRAVQTAIKFAAANGYDALMTLDADGQHHPEQLPLLYRESLRMGWDVLIGSRYVGTQNYSASPLGRRLGMKLFSAMVKLSTGHRIYDTTSGLKIISRPAFDCLMRWHFVDFHAEAIVYLLRLGYHVGEFPITVFERQHGQSMYSALSHLKYPATTSIMVLLGVVEANLTGRKRP